MDEKATCTWSNLAEEARHELPERAMELWIILILNGDAGLKALEHRLAQRDRLLQAQAALVTHPSTQNDRSILFYWFATWVSRLGVTSDECLDALQTVLGQPDVRFRSKAHEDACMGLANAGWSGRYLHAWALPTGTGKTTLFFRSCAEWQAKALQDLDRCSLITLDVVDDAKRFVHSVARSQCALYVSPFKALLSDVLSRFSNVDGLRVDQVDEDIVDPFAREAKLRMGEEHDTDLARAIVPTVLVCSTEQLGRRDNVALQPLLDRTGILFFDECHALFDSLSYRMNLGANIRLRGGQELLPDPLQCAKQRLDASLGRAVVESVGDDGKALLKSPFIPNVVLASASMAKGTFSYVASIHLTGLKRRGQRRHSMLPGTPLCIQYLS